MKTEKVLLILGLLIILGYLLGIWRDSQDIRRVNDEYIREVEEYQNAVEEYRKRAQQQFDDNLTAAGAAFGTENIRTNHFEGPEVSIHALEFWNQPRFKDSPGVLEYAYTYMAFDPDHHSLGMPDVEVTVSPVTLYDPQKTTLGERIATFLGRNPADPPRPYKVYTKEVIPNQPDSSGGKKRIEMQLWLTQFTLTITAKPDRRRKGSVNLTDREKQNRIYPGYWYGQGDLLSANDLKPEFNNNRYGNLKVWLRLKPNNSPWYVNNGFGRTQKPEMAIGAVYCLELIKEPKELNLDQISTSVGIGKELALYQQPEFGSVDLGALPIGTLDYHAYLGSSVHDTTTQSIWNRDFFVKLYLKNFGSWKEGFLGNRKFDDQLNYTFIMPVLVEGSWDVHAPYEIIPEWSPPEPYIREGIKLLPEWGLGKVGRFLSMGLIGALLVMLIFLLAPGLLSGLIAGFGRIFRGGR